MNKNKSKIMSYCTKIKFEYLGTGILFMLSGIFQSFDNTVTGFLAVICCAIAVFMTIKTMSKTAEEADEMAISNINHARSTAFSIGMLILIISTLIVSIIRVSSISNEMNLTRFFTPFITIFIGFEYIIVAKTFKSLEDE